MSNSVILTSYFSIKEHPNDPNDNCVIGRAENGKVIQNDIKYIHPWYESINRLGLNGVVFYDNLTDEFVKTYETDCVKFLKVDVSEYSNNDWRFFVYRNFLQKNSYDSVFLTDGSDVSVVKDPHRIVMDYPETNLFVCKDSIKLADFGYLDVHSMFGWDNYTWFAIEHMKRKLDLINMGVIGGKYSDILDFLDKFCLVRLKMYNPHFNADMWVGQYVIRHLLSNRNILIGDPFTSNFKKYETSRQDVYFIHK